MDNFERVVDKLIRESMERGEFDNLPGSGEPLDLKENPFEDPDVRTAHRLLRNAGFAPAWIEERKDLDAAIRNARETLIRASDIYAWQGPLSDSFQWRRAVKEFRETIAELNKRISLYNLKSPAVVFHRKAIDAEAVILELEEGK